MPFYLTLFLQFKKSVAMTSYTIFWYSLSWFLAFNFWPVNPLLKHFAVTIVRIYLMLLVIASSLANFIFSLFDSSNARPYWSSSLQQHPVACKLGRALNNCLYHFEKCLKDYYSNILWKKGNNTAPCSKNNETSISPKMKLKYIISPIAVSIICYP